MLIQKKVTTITIKRPLTPRFHRAINVSIISLLSFPPNFARATARVSPGTLTIREIRIPFRNMVGATLAVALACGVSCYRIDNPYFPCYAFIKEIVPAMKQESRLYDSAP